MCMLKEFYFTEVQFKGILKISFIALIQKRGGFLSDIVALDYEPNTHHHHMFFILLLVLYPLLLIGSKAIPNDAKLLHKVLLVDPKYAIV